MLWVMSDKVKFVYSCVDTDYAWCAVIAQCDTLSCLYIQHILNDQIFFFRIGMLLIHFCTYKLRLFAVHNLHHAIWQQQTTNGNFTITSSITQPIFISSTDWIS
jgi:hypothetical protein